MIRKATQSDIGPILQITNACANLMKQNGIYQWDENYPNQTAFETDVKRGELYVIENNEKVIGCIVLSTIMDEEYRSIDWLTPSSQNVYVHRLAIHPNEQGNGLAQRLMTFAENMAKEKGFISVRLDTFSQNLRNQRFYEQRGYQKLGDVYFPRQSEFPFHCYELLL